MYHDPVLLQESIEGLAIRPGGIYVDVTFGGGGHSREILKHLENGRLIGFDQDKQALKNTIEDERFLMVHSNFRFMRNFLRFYDALPVDGILADLGISSHQINEGERGFSTRFNADLDMRMDRSSKLTGKYIVNNFSENDLIQVFRNYGELRNARALARAIVQQRKQKEISTTGELTELSKKFSPGKTENQYAAKVFQAIRIEVNKELDVLKTFLLQSEKVLKPGGRLVVIAYHSLEDRLVKNFIKAGNFEGDIKKDFYGNPEVAFKMISRKPVVPSEEEINRNPRARSAKMRIAEKI